MIEWATKLIGDVQTLVLTGLGLFAVVFVGLIWMRTKALVPVVVALVTSGVVLWGVNNTSWFQNNVGKDTRSTGAPALVGPHHPRADDRQATAVRWVAPQGRAPHGRATRRDATGRPV